MLNDSVAFRGSLNIQKFNSEQALIDSRTINNLVVAAGKQVIASRLIGNTLPVFSHMAIGTGVANVTSSQTELIAEVGRVAFTSVARTNNTITYIATFPAGVGTGSLTESGIFNSPTTGNMLCRTNFSTFSKAAGDTIVITWQVTAT